MIKTLLTFKSDIGVLFFSLQRFGFSFGKLLLMVVNHASLMQKSCGILHWWMNVVTGMYCGANSTAEPCGWENLPP